MNCVLAILQKKYPGQALVSLTILDLFRQLKQWGYEKENRTFGKESFCGLIPIIDIKNGQNRIDILLCLADKDGDTPETLDFASRNRRTLKAEDGEGINTRGHIIIKTDPNNPTVAKFCVENKTGISAKLFVDTINYFLNDAKSRYSDYFKGNHYTLKNPDGTPVVVNTRIKLKYSPLLGDEFVEAFKMGRIKDVLFELPAKDTTPYDSSGIFKPKKQVGYLDVTASIHSLSSQQGGFGIKTIAQAFKQLTTERPDLKNATFKIHYKDQSGRQHTAKYDPLTQEFVLVKKTHTKHHKINPENLELIPELCDTMFAHIK